MIRKIPWGTQAEASTVFKLSDGAVFDPDTVHCIVQSPDRVETTYVYGTAAELALVSSGHYLFTLAFPDQVGRWVVRFKGIGDVAVTDEDEFEVLPSKMAQP